MKLRFQQWPNITIRHVTIHAQQVASIVIVIMVAYQTVLTHMIQMGKSHWQYGFRTLPLMPLYRMLNRQRCTQYKQCNRQRDEQNQEQFQNRAFLIPANTARQKTPRPMKTQEDRRVSASRLLR